MVRRLITAIAAAAVLGVVTPATARVQAPAFDATLTAKLERSWTWQTSTGCEGDAGQGRRLVTLKTSAPVPIDATGGRIPVRGFLELRGRTEHRAESPGGSCLPQEHRCSTRRVAVSGSVRLTIRSDVLRLTNLRYRSSGIPVCASEIPAVRAALRDEPRLESVAVRDREQRLRNVRIPRITATGRASPSARLDGDVTGEVRAEASWTLVLTRR